MGRAVDAHLTQLLGGLAGHGAVALHNPGGDFLIALPGGVLDNDAMLGLRGLGGGHTDAVVIIDLFNGHLGPFLGDVVKAGLGAALGHMDHGLLTQLIGRPGHAPAVIAVGGGKEGGLPEGGAEGGAGEVVVGQLRDILSHFPGNIPGHSEGTAQHLKGVEAEAVGLVLHIQAGQAQITGHAVQPGQGGDGVLGKAAVERAGLVHAVQRHNGELPVVTFGHPVDGPLDGLVHGVVASRII